MCNLSADLCQEPVGMDYTEPLLENSCKPTHVKCYFAVFVCFSTKAVHRELANDLTVETLSKIFSLLWTSYTYLSRGHEFHRNPDGAV